MNNSIMMNKTQLIIGAHTFVLLSYVNELTLNCCYAMCSTKKKTFKEEFTCLDTYIILYCVSFSVKKAIISNINNVTVVDFVVVAINCLIRKITFFWFKKPLNHFVIPFIKVVNKFFVITIFANTTYTSNNDMTCRI